MPGTPRRESRIQPGGISASLTSRAALKTRKWCGVVPARTAGVRGLLLGDHHGVLLGERESRARPVLQPLDCIEVPGALAGLAQAPGALGIPEAHSQGMREAWITSGTPWPPTDLIARSTSFSGKRCVVTLSRAKRFDASCCSASSQAL
jgi:hypothetical protein